MLKWVCIPRIVRVCLFSHMAQLNQKYIKRQIQDKIASHLLKKEMTVILGPRQVGKTVLLNQLQNWLKKDKKISEDAIFYYNLDIIKDWEVVREQTQFIEFLRSRSKQRKIYVFIDEAQRVVDPGRFFKGVYDSQLNVKFTLTGSSSLEFASKIKESLAGRKRVFRLYPFSFNEFLAAKNEKLKKILETKGQLSAIDQKNLRTFFEEYVIWGGYPRIVFGENHNDKRAVLDDIYSSYIEKDIVGFLQIKNKAKFNKLVKLLAGQIGQLINIDELATNIELDRDTIDRYLTALQETYIVFNLPPYYKNPRQEIIKTHKAFFIDNGMRNYLLDDFKDLSVRPDRGALFENSILKELLLWQDEKLFKLRFWRNKQGAEVDFVIEQGRRLIPIEAKLKIKSNRTFSGLRGFIKKYQPTEAVMVSLDGQGRSLADKTKINFIQPYELKKYL